MRQEKLVTNALLKLLREPFPGDPKGRSGSEILALALMKAAVGGSTPAASLIAERCEGKVKDVVELAESRTPEEVRERLIALTEKIRARGGSERIQ